ncbi:hypothetical protein ElyMa_002776300 [Elysia marginata]|uniref:CBM20 domain-containing protein n=1 Tax=Elysia marginata TaxID=1093978 RepID=A0AAV4HLJ4_9GAST|nr:hypothetical protein ElyMa_002776300 [Elysia marginata]
MDDDDDVKTVVEYRKIVDDMKTAAVKGSNHTKDTHFGHFHLKPSVVSPGCEMKFNSYKSNEVGVEFKVWAPSFDRVTHRLYLLGSLKELGAWAIEEALEAFPTKGWTQKPSRVIVKSFNKA